MEVDIAQYLLPHAVTQADIFESNKCMTRYHNPNPAAPILERFMMKHSASSNRFRQSRDSGCI